MQTARKRSLLDRALPLALLLPLLAGACATMPGDQKGAISSDPSVNLMRLARTAETKGDPRSAAALYQQAHVVSPSSVEPLLALGASLRAQEHDAAAAEAYRRVLAIDPRNSDALRGLGMALVAQEDPRSALDSFNVALHVNSRDARAWNGRGVALDMLARHAEAQHAYRTGLTLKQDDEALRNNLVLSQSLSPAEPQAPSKPVLASPAQPRTAARANLAQAATATPAPGGWAVVSSR